mmetsp:Transcript_11330/g.21021  ORF Transcript_11330/g.21021 Transcript_11330/m.21021 type:complete len:301 (-) Transcript_11330:253-1155(-)
MSTWLALMRPSYSNCRRIPLLNKIPVGRCTLDSPTNTSISESDPASEVESPPRLTNSSSRIRYVFRPAAVVDAVDAVEIAEPVEVDEGGSMSSIFTCFSSSSSGLPSSFTQPILPLKLEPSLTTFTTSPTAKLKPPLSEALVVWSLGGRTASMMLEGPSRACSAPLATTRFVSSVLAFMGRVSLHPCGNGRAKNTASSDSALGAHLVVTSLFKYASKVWMRCFTRAARPHTVNGFANAPGHTFSNSGYMAKCCSWKALSTLKRLATVYCTTTSRSWSWNVSEESGSRPSYRSCRQVTFIR